MTTSPQTRAHAPQIEIGDTARIVAKPSKGGVHLHVEDERGLVVVSMTITVGTVHQIRDALRLALIEIDRAEMVEATHRFYNGMTPFAADFARAAGWVADGNVVLGDE